MNRKIIIMLLAALLLFPGLISGCNAEVEIFDHDPEGTAAASIPTATQPPTRTVMSQTETATATAAISPTPFMTATETSNGSGTDAEGENEAVTEPATDVDCPTPMSLMLHSAYGWERMVDLADVIEEHQLVTITYRTLRDYLNRGECAPENAIIVSLDDLGSNWLRYDFREMVQIFLDRDLVLVVGVVTKGPQDPEIWQYLNDIHAHGVEIASHTMNHYQLDALVPDYLEIEVVGSYDIICEELGECPITLVLPFGSYNDDVLEMAAIYDFIVIIQGGLSIQSPTPYIIGRIPPDNDDQEITLALLEGTYH